MFVVVLVMVVEIMWSWLWWRLSLLSGWIFGSCPKQCLFEKVQVFFSIRLHSFGSFGGNTVPAI